ncbi:cellulase family glycosylhydrolase [Arcticibacter sp.]|uniref:cellulase family glycosylhydrolase n=1 Tax=Arcticibacter sp. TaxID=1872630 RepID=UPI00388FE5C7
MRFLKIKFLLLAFSGIILQSCSLQRPTQTTGRTIWSKDKANDWYASQKWLVGANFIPSTAINQLEMWQESSFDTITINRELGLAESIGMNTMRVYLHDLLWDQDSTGFLNRINTFLEISEKHKIKPLFVLFDSCWDPFPKLGKQNAPTPFVHNSGWVQSPGFTALKDSTQYPRLERFVKGIIRNLRNDKRILGWDVWNEPDNLNTSSYGKRELPNKIDYVLPLLKKTFLWARSVNPSQPLTSGVWLGEWSSDEKLKSIDKLQLEESDIITFHNYDNAEEFEKRILWLQRYGRPIICTEYMARGNNSTFQSSLPVARQYRTGVFNWGLVDGKTQTKMPWDSWDKQYTADPALWFHEIFHSDGKPYIPEETKLIQELTGKTNPR